LPPESEEARSIAGSLAEARGKSGGAPMADAGKAAAQEPRRCRV